MAKATCQCGGIWNKRHDENGNAIWQCGLYSDHSKPRQIRTSSKRKTIDALIAELLEEAQ